MGRKKGKQRGQFSSKVQRAEVYATHLSAASSSSWIDPRYGIGQASKTMSHANGQKRSQLQELRAERGTVSLTQLRGLLRERRMEDTIEYQQARRRNIVMTRTTTSTAQEDPSAGEAGNQSERHAPGWILNYGDEPSATSSNRYRRQGEGIPSLQSWCVHALGPALTAYTDAYGVDTMRSILDTLPPEVLADLSISVCSKGIGVDNSLVTVLGLHNHVERLALHAMPGRVTAEGILSIVPRIVSGRQESTTNSMIKELPEDDDSWEELACSVSFEGCTRISRLELCNLQIPPTGDVDNAYERAAAQETELLNAVTKLLRLCPHITHLSLSGSFSLYQSGYHLIKNIPLLLPKLSVLDLSHCVWVDDTLMHCFLSDTVARSSEVTPGKDDRAALPTINVAGCHNISEDRMASLQEEITWGRN